MKTIKYLEKILRENGATFYELNCCRAFVSALCDRQRLPKFILDLLPREIFSIKINWEEMKKFRNDPLPLLQSKISPEKEKELIGTFYKLSSRSSKDYRLPKFVSLEEISKVPTNSPRWYDDLYQSEKLKLDTYLYFLEFLEDCDISKEVRVFIADKKVQGITAYNYCEKVYHFSDNFMERVKIEVENKILQPLTAKFQGPDNWDLNNFVIDAYERADGSVQFLEVNPYEQSDPCCYENHSQIGNPLFCRNDR